MTDPLGGAPRPRPLPRPIPVAAPPAAPRPPFVPPPPRKVNRTAVLAIVLTTAGLTILLLCSGVAALSYTLMRQQSPSAGNIAQRTAFTGPGSRTWSPPVATPFDGDDRSPLAEVEEPPAIRQPTEEELDNQLPPFERHLKWLKGSDNTKVHEAATWFARQPLDTSRQADVVAALRLQLQRYYPIDRSSLLAAANVWGDESLIPALVSFARSYEEEAPAALASVGKYNTPEAQAALVSFLGLPERQANAARQVLTSHPALAKEALLPQVHADNRRVRDAARAVLQELGVTDDDLFAQSLQQIDSGDPFQRVAVVEWFAKAELSDEHRAQVLPVLVKRLASTDFGERTAALKALANDPSEASSDALLTAFDSAAQDGTEVLTILIDRGDKRLAAKLEPILKERSRRGRVMIAIKQAKQPEGLLRELLTTTTDREVMRHVVMFHRDAFTKDSIPALEKIEKLAMEQNDRLLATVARKAIDSAKTK